MHLASAVSLCYDAVSPLLIACPVQIHGVELEIDNDRVSPSDVFDLHAPHQRSGATDLDNVPYVPSEWKPFNDHIVQVLHASLKQTLKHEALDLRGGHVIETDGLSTMTAYASVSADPVHISRARKRGSETKQNPERDNAPAPHAQAVAICLG